MSGAKQYLAGWRVHAVRDLRTAAGRDQPGRRGLAALWARTIPGRLWVRAVPFHRISRGPASTSHGGSSPTSSATESPIDRVHLRCGARVGVVRRCRPTGRARGQARSRPRSAASRALRVLRLTSPDGVHLLNEPVPLPARGSSTEGERQLLAGARAVLRVDPRAQRSPLTTSS